MRRYDSYKDSGIEWIGEIPSHWDWVKYKNLGDKTTISIGVDDFNEIDVIHYSIPNVQTFGKGVKEFGGDIDSSKLLFKGGELIISKLNPRKSCVSIVEPSYESEVIVGSGEFVVLSPTRTDIKFLFYFLKNQPFTDYLDSSVESVTRSHQRVNPSIIYNSFVPIPTLSEQQQIVSYLDTKTSLIDSLIEKTKRKIELLNENRTSLINEVVTKGLNSNVEMKNSGVEWIGEIPSHWERKRLKHITNSINGYSFKSDDFDREFDIPVIRIGDVGDMIDFDDCVKVKSHFLEDKKEFIVKKDDILIGLTGGTIGKSGKYNYDSPSLLNQRVGLLRNKPSVLNGLLYHYVKSEVFIRYIFFDCYGGGQDNISMGDILNMVFPYPPLLEQTEIVSYLDEHTQLIDKTISVEQRRIDTLKEYRQSLISEVVTGKRKVLN
jgi:type I restriction enzyme S subunit